MKVLLHACCAPCSAYVCEFLENEGYEITIYFYNPNIFPTEEYEKRKNELIKFCELKNYKLILGEDDFNSWNDYIKGLEQEPERGKRCEKCFYFRLEKTAILAKELNMENFTTTLSISPHKDFSTIEKVGNELMEKYGIKFLNYNFKKNDGYKKSTLLSQKYGFYRQNYCGCKYSIRV